MAKNDSCPECDGAMLICDHCDEPFCPACDEGSSEGGDRQTENGPVAHPNTCGGCAKKNAF